METVPLASWLLLDLVTYGYPSTSPSFMHFWRYNGEPYVESRYGLEVPEVPTRILRRLKVTYSIVADVNINAYETKLLSDYWLYSTVIEPLLKDHLETYFSDVEGRRGIPTEILSKIPKNISLNQVILASPSISQICPPDFAEEGPLYSVNSEFSRVQKILYCYKAILMHCAGHYGI